MPVEARPSFVLDASVAAKRWFDEPDSAAAKRALAGAGSLIAPDYLVIEMASIAAKRVRRGLEAKEHAGRAIQEVATIVDELEPSSPLARRAYELACDHGVSAYDGLYLALAEARGAVVLTADARLVKLARAAGLGHLVRPLVP